MYIHIYIQLNYRVSSAIKIKSYFELFGSLQQPLHLYIEHVQNDSKIDLVAFVTLLFDRNRYL